MADRSRPLSAMSWLSIGCVQSPAGCGLCDGAREFCACREFCVRRELRETGRMFYNEKYKGHFDALADATAGYGVRYAGRLVSHGQPNVSLM